MGARGGMNADVIEAEYEDVASSRDEDTGDGDDDTDGGWRWRPPQGDVRMGLELREETPPQWELGCYTKLNMRVQVPRPLSIAPSFLLGGAFSVIAGAVMQAVLPRFAEFLAADYERWANGEDREAPVGSFVEDEDEDEDGEEKTAGSSSGGGGSGSGSDSGEEAESLADPALVK